jgi:transcriptional regulator with GAF, ATPase, and Fis domain
LLQRNRRNRFRIVRQFRLERDGFAGAAAARLLGLKRTTLQSRLRAAAHHPPPAGS